MCNQTLFVPSENMTISMSYFQLQSHLVVNFGTTLYTKLIK